MGWLANLFGRSRRNAAVAAKAESRLSAYTQQARAKTGYRGSSPIRDAVRRQQPKVDAYEQLRADIKRDREAAFARAEADLRPVGPLTDPDDETREVTESDPEVDWQPVTSSNVAAVRWVASAQFGLQVKFLNGYEYEYQVDHQVYLDMLGSASKGKFVWWMRRSQIPYHRLVGGKHLQTVMYPFGAELKEGKLRFPDKAVGAFYKHWSTPTPAAAEAIRAWRGKR